MGFPYENGVNGHFRLMGSGESIHLDHYIPEFLKENPDVELIIGCDSQSIANHTIFVTTVVLRYDQRGAHVIYHKEKLPRNNDLWSRLWSEMERSAGIAVHVRDKIGIQPAQIDLDLNDDPKYASFKVRAAAMGYLESLGFKPRTKPHLLPAKGAANFLCK